MEKNEYGEDSRELSMRQRMFKFISIQAHLDLIMSHHCQNVCVCSFVCCSVSTERVEGALSDHQCVHVILGH